MAVSFSYNATYTNCAYIYRATGGGVTFSANLAGGAVLDYFTDTAVTNDCIYFAPSFATYAFSNLKIEVGTPLVGGTGVWEYYAAASTTTAAGWRPIHNLTDPSNGFTVAGAHTIIFPLQAGMYTVTVNGIVGYCWIRYRLTGGTVTEGGANVTTRAQTSNGRLVTNGGTDIAPITFTNIYDWVSVNAPEVCATKIGSVFNFPNMAFYMVSRVKTNNEIILIGNGGDISHYFDYLESGTKVGTDGWKDCSYFFFCQRSSGSRLTWTSTVKFYGGSISGFNNVADGLIWPSTGYLGLGLGEWIGATVDYLPSGYFGAGMVANKITTKGGIISTSFPTNYPDNHRISDALAVVFYLYNAGGTITNLSYSMPTYAIFSFNQGGNGNWEINFQDCSPSLPSQTDTIKALARTTTAPTGNMLSVFYYDASANTFTDYTTQANNDTAGDVPLSGDEGDIYYFRYATNGYAGQVVHSFTVPSQANDYTYVWEYNNGYTWVALSQTWDLTDNFTKSGYIYNAQAGQAVAATVNSVTGFYYRLRIVTKGTTSPVCTRIKASIQNGVGQWKINEKYSAIIKVENTDGTALEGATITFTNKDGTDTVLTTDVSGLTTQTYFTVNVLEFDPVNGDATFNILKSTLNPYTITVEKEGYETVTIPLTISEKLKLTLALKPQITKLEDDNGNVFDRVDKTNSGTTNLRRKLVKA